MSHMASLIKLSVITTLLVTSVGTSATNREPLLIADDGDTARALEGRSDMHNFHDRKMFATIAHAKATATLSQATYVYTQHMRLYREKIKSEMDMLETEIAMLNASVNHSFTEYAMKHESLRYEIGLLKASWSNGGAGRDLKKLAGLYVDIRQRYLEHSEFLSSEYSKLLKARERVYAIKFDLAKSKIVSEEEVNEARVLKDQSSMEVGAITEQLAFAKQALIEAQKDLDAIGG